MTQYHFQNESKRHRLEYYTQGGEKDPKWLCERMVCRAGFYGEAVLERPGVSQNQRNHWSSQVLWSSGFYCVLA